MEGPAPSPDHSWKFFDKYIHSSKISTAPPSPFFNLIFILLFYGFWNQVDNSLSNFFSNV